MIITKVPVFIAPRPFVRTFLRYCSNNSRVIAILLWVFLCKDVTVKRFYALLFHHIIAGIASYAYENSERHITFHFEPSDDFFIIFETFIVLIFFEILIFNFSCAEAGNTHYLLATIG